MSEAPSATRRAAAKTAPSQPRGCTNAKLRQLARVVTREFDAEVCGAGMKTSQYSLLSNIVALGPVRPSDLAAAMRLDASTLTRNLQPLVASGWIELGAGADGRSRLVSITAAGREKQAETRAAWKRAQLAFNDRIGIERVARLHALIDECLELLEADDGEADGND